MGYTGPSAPGADPSSGAPPADFSRDVAVPGTALGSVWVGGDVSCPQLSCHPGGCFPSGPECWRVREGTCVYSSVSDADADSRPFLGGNAVGSGKVLGWLPAGPCRILSYIIN